jgi:hypothetical protein
MNKVPFGCSHKPYWTSDNIISVSTPSKKFWFTGRILHQKMPPGNQLPLCKSFLILSLEDKDLFQGGGHVRDQTVDIMVVAGGINLYV